MLANLLHKKILLRLPVFLNHLSHGQVAIIEQRGGVTYSPSKSSLSPYTSDESQNVSPDAKTWSKKANLWSSGSFLP